MTLSKSLFGVVASHTAFPECSLRWLIRDYCVSLSQVPRGGISEVISIFMTLDILEAILQLQSFSYILLDVPPQGSANL